jgi:phage gp45-like
MNLWKVECDAKCEQYTINAKYTISIDCPEKKLKGEIT